MPTTLLADAENKVLKEKPTMKEPKEENYWHSGKGIDGEHIDKFEERYYREDVTNYENHIAGLKSYSLAPSLQWPEEWTNWKELIEGKDFEFEYQFHSTEVVDISEADKWIETSRTTYETVHPKNRRIVIIPLSSIEEEEKKDKRKPGYYWVRFHDGDWVLGWWFFGNYWLLPASIDNKRDSYFAEINENMVCPQEPPQSKVDAAEGEEKPI